jgi:hypothetical protein
MITEIYKNYFQKSTAFLYPILGFKKSRHPQPKRTYLTWNDKYSTEDKKMICVFMPKDTDAWKDFETHYLLNHPLFETCYQVKSDEGEDLIAYVFDLKMFEKDYDYFLEGKYSELSKEHKKKLSDYYGVHTPEWFYIESYIFPSKYFDQYAKLLNVDVKMIEEVGQLCRPYDPEQETCPYKLEESTISNF